MERLRRIAETLLGVILAVTPAVLWIAWTPALLVGAMLVAVICALLLALLAEPAPRAAPDAPAPLPPEFIEEVHQLFPLTYHHSNRETPRFRRAMQRLSRLIAQR